MSRSWNLVFVAALLAWVVWAPVASADAGLHFVEVGPKSIRLDGSLREWPREAFRALGQGRDGAMHYALGYDERGIYLAADVADGDLSRRSRPGASDDGIRLTFVVPGGGAAVQVFVFPALPGEAPSGAYVGTETAPRAIVRGAEVIEEITSEGYSIEAFIPFAGFKGLTDFARARGAVALIDADPGRPTRRISSSEGELPPIMGSGGELGAFTEFLRSEGLEGTRPTFDFRADVLGGKRAERVALVGSTLFVGGGDHADGASFETLRLGAVREAHEATLVDLTGEGRAELFLKATTATRDGTMGEVFVVTFERGRPELSLRVPYALHQRGRTLENQVKLEPRPGKRGPKLVVIRAGRAEGFDASTLGQDGDDESLLLPWGPLAARAYDLAGGRLRVAFVEENPRYAPPSREPGAAAEVSSAPPTLDRLIEAARQQLGLPRGAKRRFEHETNLAGDRTKERLVVIDRTVLVVGPAYRGGTSYFQMQLDLDAPERIRRVHSVDVDGDGRDEVIFRINQDLGQGASRCVILVYRFTEAGASLVHAREIARYYQGASVLNTYRVVGKGKRRSIVFSPGEAKGFSETNWPFPPLEGDSFEPLLLPWRDREVSKRL